MKVKIYVLHCPSPDAESLLRETLRSLPNAIVVGNGISGDITQKENLGVASGYNLAMADAFESGVDYFVLSNNDIEAEAGAVEILIEALRDDKKAGIAVPKILYHEDRGRLWYAGGKISLWSGVAHHVGIGKKDFPGKGCYTDYACGAFMALRTEAAREVGFMDERFSCQLVYREEFKLASFLDTPLKDLQKMIRTHSFCGKCMKAGGQQYQRCYSDMALFDNPIADADRERRKSKVNEGWAKVVRP